MASGATSNPAREPAGLDVLPALPLTEDEATYLRAARATNTLRGYRSDWREFTTWCTAQRVEPLPAAATLTGYLTALAQAGAAVGTMSRRLSAIKFAHAAHDHPDPTTAARVRTVLEGICQVHTEPADQARPLMFPELGDVLGACPVTKTWKTPGRPPERSLAGARDRALLLVGFVGALLRSELSALDRADVTEHPTAWSRPCADPRPTRPASSTNSSSYPAPRTPTAARSWP